MLFTKTLLFLSVVATAAQGSCGPPPPPGMLPGWDWSSPMSASQILDCVTSSTANSYDTNERPTVGMMRKEALSEPGYCQVQHDTTPVAPPDSVTTNFYIDKLTVNQKTLTYTLDGYLRAYWKDPRLAFNQSCGVNKLNLKGRSYLIWLPDFYFEKAQTISLGTAPRAEGLEVYPDGSIWWSRQSSIMLSCSMYFGNLPFDDQKCKYMLGMYSQSALEVSLTWSVDSTTGAIKSLSNFENVGTATWTTLDVEPKNSEYWYSGVPYTYAEADLHVRRIDQSYVLSYLVLAALVVFMSYAGFYISPAAAPGRIALAVITVLVLNNLSSSAKGQLPPFAYNTWLTDFLFGSMLFNLVAFFNYAAVNFGGQMDNKLKALTEAKKKAAKAAEDAGIQMVGQGEGAKVGMIGVTTHQKTKSQEIFETLLPYLAKLKDLDHTMRWAFLLAYAIFLIGMAGVKGTYKPSH